MTLRLSAVVTWSLCLVKYVAILFHGLWAMSMLCLRRIRAVIFEVLWMYGRVALFFLRGLVGVFLVCLRLFLLCVAVFENEIDRVVVFDKHVVEVFALFFFALNCVAPRSTGI